EAESHAEDDKKKRELIEARNQADTLAYSVEKNLKEMGDQIDSAEKSKIETSLEKVKKAMENDDIDAIKSAQEELTQASHKLAEAMYAKATAKEEGAGAEAAGAEGEAQAGTSDDDVVDADFEEVNKE
ncbi:MAG: Hsp70 family protein, partial [Thermodesulfobacteriota bacterium]|nr:Hsp70 family protein [Thermodesulfobacteriota bacterium]